MKQRLQKYADAIDAMALRERAMFFAAVALVLMTLLQVFLLNPVLSRRSELEARIAQQNDETQAIRALIQSLVRPDAPDRNAANREQLKRLRQQLAQLDRQFEQQQKQFVAPEKMAAMLKSMIAKNGKLELVSLQKLPGSRVTPGAGTPAGAARAVFRHTVQLSVKGDYFELLDYLDALERLPQRVFWEEFDLSVAQHPQSVLKLTLYTLSLEQSWLTV